MLRFGIGGKLLTLLAVMFVGFVLLAGFASWTIYESISNGRIDKVRGLAEASISMVKTAYARYQRGELTEEAAKSLVKDQLRPARFGKDDYFFIYSYGGEQVLDGIRPEREGKNFYATKDLDGKQFVREQIESARDGTNVVTYMFARAGSDVPVPSLSYTIAFDPWYWVIGTGVYVDDINARFAEIAWEFFAITIALGLLIAACGYLLSRQIIRNEIGLDQPGAC